MELDASEQHAAAQELKARRRHGAKRNLATTSGQRQTTQEERDDEDLARLQRCQELLQQLPKGSRYANHRRKVVQRALQLLQLRKQQRSVEMQDDLEQLLQTLQLG